MFMLSCEHLFTSSHFTPGAHPSATSEGTLSPSYSGFFRTDVPSSQYRAIFARAPTPHFLEAGPSLMKKAYHPCSFRQANSRLTHSGLLD
jgi:hypothetical protein